MAGAGDVDYEVDSFLEKKITDDLRVEYLVRWKGFPPDYDTWEPVKGLGNCTQKIKEFEQRHRTSVMAVQKQAKKLVDKSKAKKENLGVISVKGKGKKELKVLKKNANNVIQRGGAKGKDTEIEKGAKTVAGKKSKVQKIQATKTNQKAVQKTLTVKYKLVSKSSTGKDGKKESKKKISLGKKTLNVPKAAKAKKSLEANSGKKSISKDMKKQQTKPTVKIVKPGKSQNDISSNTPARKHILFSKNVTPASMDESVSKVSPGSVGKKNKQKKCELRLSIDGLLGLSNRKSPSVGEPSDESEENGKGSKSLLGIKSSLSQPLKRMDKQLPQGKKRKRDDMKGDITVSIISEDSDSDSDVLYSFVESDSTEGDWNINQSNNNDYNRLPSNSSKKGKQKVLANRTDNDVVKSKKNNIHVKETGQMDGAKQSKGKKMRLLDSLKTSVKPALGPVSPSQVYTTVKSVLAGMDPHSEMAPGHQNFRGDIPTYQYVVQPSAVIPVSPSSMSYRMLLENLPQQMHPKKSKKRLADEAEEVERRISVRSSEGAFRYKEILIKKCQRYTQIWLDTNTRMKNTLNPQVMEEIVSALNAAKFDDSTLVMFSGLDNVFCSGLDLTFLTTGDKKAAARRMVDALRDFIKAIIKFPKPLVAVVTGPAIGLGMTMLPLCDVVYASDKATFHLPYNQLAQTPEGCASYTLPHALGMAMANDLLIGGRRITAIEACQLGLISQVFWPTSMMQEVIPRVQYMALQSGKVLEATKLLVRSHQRTKLDLTSETENNLLLELWPSAECQKAMTDYMNNEKNYTF